MTVVLLIPLMFNDGSSGTLGIGFKSYDDCANGMRSMQEQIQQNNKKEDAKVTEYAMACVETRKAPQGDGV